MSKYDVIKLNVNGKQDYAVKVRTSFSEKEVSGANLSIHDKVNYKNRGILIDRVHEYIKDGKYSEALDLLLDCLEFEKNICKVSKKDAGSVVGLATITCFSVALSYFLNSDFGTVVSSYGACGTLLYMGSISRELVKRFMIHKQISKLSKVKNDLENYKTINIENPKTK